MMDDRTDDGEDLQAILPEQRKELIAATTLDSDVDMAFNLQIHEAITASLALQPSSSSTSNASREMMDDRTDDGEDLQAILAQQRKELIAATTFDSDLDMAFDQPIQEAITASLALQPSSSSTSNASREMMVDRTDDGEVLRAILAQQRKELIAAMTLDADLDMAFDQPIQEAITASLALQPSSSSTSNASREMMDDRMDDGEVLQAILAEQRKELIAAMTLDSDLDMAFNLQIQEAITASLAFQPSSSSTSNALQQHPPYEPKDDLLDIVAMLMLEDVKRFSLELSDHESIVSEMKKVKAELDCRIHDHKFANDVLNAPENYWRKEGAYFERPYCANNNTVEPAAECLRVYCKGLISEEMVMNVNVVVAGIGVAICDPRDNLIFEAKKNIEALVDGQIISNEAADLEALIDALNKALDLDLKNVTFFCDDNEVYQYVTNCVIPGNSRIATLVNEVASLQGKFESCRPILVCHKDIKFAFKFARDAIFSQITWHVETSNGKSLKETCRICFEDTDASQMFSNDGCHHRYCISCMKQHVEVKLLSGMVAQCPHEGCKSEVNIDSYENLLAPKLVKLKHLQIEESSIPVTERVYCPYPKCSVVMSKTEVLEYTKTYIASAPQSGSRKCMKCLFYFCINCMVPWHFELSCDEYKRSHPFPPIEDQLLKSLATKEKWSKCVKCNRIVELASGCYHITCRCKYEFCYTCGAEWKSKRPTCSCPIWDELNIIHR